ncbi:glycosyltransferase family 2 protein [Paucilactobacillus hokkaidonensis]|uniref:glycosyltransferase family 2 protein n=1 Tax=Paucilactobacillus hokkaidonensis TaxID=1193095 RepID=UPI0006D1921D|nr:glycosyltransferase [Paucilactobacillus hokkaidonensis]
MKNNLLSIVIPAYNVDNYLENSVKSLGNFLFDTRVEIIILNDGSTDRTLKIANHLKNIYCNITVIDKKMVGYQILEILAIVLQQGSTFIF